MEDKLQELQEFHSAIGFDLAEKRNDLELLASKEERRYFFMANKDYTEHCHCSNWNNIYIRNVRYSLY